LPAARCENLFQRYFALVDCMFDLVLSSMRSGRMAMIAVCLATWLRCPCGANATCGDYLSAAGHHSQPGIVGDVWRSMAAADGHAEKSACNLIPRAPRGHGPACDPGSAPAAVDVSNAGLSPGRRVELENNHVLLLVVPTRIVTGVNETPAEGWTSRIFRPPES
jgi:hypothetical protein